MQFLSVLQSILGSFSLVDGSSIHSSRIGSQGQQAKQGVPHSPLPSHAFQLILGDPEALPGQMGYVVPPANSGSNSRSPPSWKCRVNLQRKASRWRPDKIPQPPQLTPFNKKEQQLYSELPLNVRTPNLISKALAQPRLGVLLFLIIILVFSCRQIFLVKTRMVQPHRGFNHTTTFGNPSLEKLSY